jgi:hypothetical protein
VKDFLGILVRRDECGVSARLGVWLKGFE